MNEKTIPQAGGWQVRVADTTRPAEEAGGALMINAERLRELLLYDPESGTFSRPAAPGAGQPGWITRGYRRIQIDGRAYRAHQLAWIYVHGATPPGLIDHINGHRDDNRIANLRIADKQQNGANMRSRRDGMPKGVRAYRHLFQAYIKVARRSFCLGYYPTPDEAAHAYNKAAIKHFGEFACLNPVGTK